MDELAPRKKQSPLLIGAVVLIVGLAIWAVAWGQQSITSSSTAASSTAGSSASAPAPTSSITTDSSHASGYIYAYLSALSDLYQASQSYTNAQQTLGANSQDTAVMSSLDETVNDMKDASANLAPYINDQDQAIEASAKLFYADINIELKDVTQMQSSYTYGVDNQSVQAMQAFQSEIAAYAADKSSTESDLLKGLQAVKYVIETPSNDPQPTGAINYAISDSDRTFLVSEVGTLFPSPLDHAAGQSNVYLLYARVIYVFLTSGTYEQQAATQV